MSDHSDSLDYRHGGPDVIGCSGLLLLFALVAYVAWSVVTGLGSRATSPAVVVAAAAASETPLVTVTADLNALARVTAPAPTETSAPTATPLALADHSATVAPTPTALPTAPPTEPPAPTATAVPQVEAEQLPAAAQQSPLPTPAAESLPAVRVPILMYHYVDVPPPNADKYRHDLTVTPDALRWQLQYLRDSGYTVIDLYDLAAILANQQPAPPKPVILTFDDGYRDNYSNAFPLLQQFGMKAVFFVVADPVDQAHPSYMTWPMAAEMVEAGMSVEIHTRTHPNLTALEPDKQLKEIKEAQEMITYHTGEMPRFLSYPSGRYDATTLSIVQSLDLWGAVTTRHGRDHSYDGRYQLKRVRVRNSTNLPVFIDLLESND